MTASTPVDPRIRLAIAQWPDDAPRGAVSTFCAEHDISRKTFYVLRRRAKEHGEASVLEPRSRRPRTTPNKLSDETKSQAVQVRASLASSGLDHGPISVHDKMRAMRLEYVPSVASLARIFREAGVARVEPRKKPRSAWRRFVYPAPNACWQLDATDYVLTGGRRCTIFQLIDDHSRFALASHVADSETADAAVIVFDKAVTAHGVPQRLLTDNGAAFNTSRRGLTSRLVAHIAALGVEAITGKPYKPTTQGKNERFHQTLFRFLDKQPLADTFDVLQSQVDAFDSLYNTERPHQGLPGRVTPLVAWEATPKAEPPRPKARPIYFPQPPTRRPRMSSPAPRSTTDSVIIRILNSTGSFRLDGVTYMVGAHYRYETVLVLVDGEDLIITSEHGEVIAEHTRPAPGATYVGNGRPKGRWRELPNSSPSS